MGMVEKVMNGVVHRAEQNAPEKYCFDAEGFRVCPKCGTRMQFEISLFGEVRRVPVLCQCRAQELEAEEERKRRRQAQNRVEELRRTGMMDREYLSYRLENDDWQNARVSDAVRRYIDKWDDLKAKNTGLMFYGPTGTGKTFFAGAIANALIDKGVPVLMASLPSLVSAMSKGFDENRAEIMYRISHWPLVIIDDLGVERNTEWMMEKVNEIVDARYLSGLPLIITTNLSPAEMKSPENLSSRRIFDRIIERCYPIAVTGESRRKIFARQSRPEIADILGV